MSDSRGEDADIPEYPGQDRPAGPGAEAMALPTEEGESPDAATPSEQRGEG